MEIKVPKLPESVSSATVLSWNKKLNEAVKKDEIIVELETDKIVLEVPATGDGVITSIVVNEGETVGSQAVLGELDTNAKVDFNSEKETTKAAKPDENEPETTKPDTLAGPSVRRMINQHDLNITTGSGKHGKITKADVQKELANKNTHKPSTSEEKVSTAIQENQEVFEQVKTPMSSLRKRIAAKLVQAKNTTAMLTTFNEVSLDAIINIRKQYQEQFVKKHGIKLGFMSFFAKACCIALQEFPLINARIDNDSIIQHNYVNMGIAVSTDKGLVVPVIKNAQTLSLAAIETQIKAYAEKARSQSLQLDDMLDGTFSITNGGVFGSMLSTPILNAPQTAILGMHNIQKRPVVVNDEIVIKNMMYLALSYDHRLVDGKDSVSFLVKVKKLLEDPHTMLIGV